MNQEDALKLVQEQFLESSRVLAEVGRTAGNFVTDSATMIETALRAGGTFFTCGNGGSAADAQHIAAELAGRFYLDRPGLSAAALSVNTSSMTGIANDYDYSEVFARQLQGQGKPGDVLMAITTSGGSANVVKAVSRARDLKMTVIGLTGSRGQKFADSCDLALMVPSEDVARIQESHICAGHLICQLVEASLFGGSKK